jgi:predicted metal-dependent hydrolase
MGVFVVAQLINFGKIVIMNFFSKRGQIPQTTSIELDGEPTEILVRENARAKRYKITLDSRHGIVLTVPKSGNWRDAEKFLHAQRNWLAARQHHIAERKLIANGEIIPLRGMETKIVGTGKVRGTPELEPGTPTILHMPGAKEHIGRRTVDWLKSEAKTELTLRSHIHAQNLGVTYKTISMRDQSTRWGSCSSKGALNYNWRLIMAPSFVLDYVAAHEVAHLIEMNHSDRFWATVERTLPDMQRGRAWLKAHGRTLFAYQVG